MREQAGAEPPVGDRRKQASDPTEALGPGRPLESGSRGHLEQALGASLQDIRVHDDAAAARFAGQAGARAATYGAHIAFAPGEYRPGTLVGDAILAHEAAHALQQRGAVDASHAISDAPLEADADGAALAAVAGALTGATFVRQPRLSSGLRVSRCSGRKQSATKQAPTTTAPTPDAAPPADWDFTPADYAALRQGGHELQVAIDSGWFPSKLQANLLATLRVLLNPPAGTPAPTAGVNVKDLYHGHVAVPKGTRIPAALTAKVTTFSREEETRTTAALGSTSGPVTSANIAAYQTAMTGILPFAQAVLDEALQLPGVVVVYHTYERSGPPMQYGDPRRNWMTPLATNVPKQFRPPDPENASSYLDNYREILQFSFLVDASGGVHIRTGTTMELTTVTGQPESP